MATTLQNIQRLRVWQESSFNTDGSGTLGNYMDVPVIRGSIDAKIDRASLDKRHAKQRPDAHSTRKKGRKTCTLSFSMALASTGTAADDTTAQVEGALGRILEIVLGGENLGVGEAVEASPSPTTTAYGVGDAAAANIEAGSCVGLNSGASSAYEMRIVEGVATNVVTTKLAVSNAPSSTDDVYGCATYYLTSNPTGTLQFVLEGEAAINAWVFCGMQLDSLTFDLPLNEIPTVTFNLKGFLWLNGADSAGSGSFDGVDAATYANEEHTYVFGEFLYQDVGTATRPTPTCVHSVTLNPNIVYNERPCPSGTGNSGVHGWRRMSDPPVMTIMFRDDYEDQTYESDRDNTALQNIAYQLGNVAGSAVLLEFPAVEIIDVQVPKGEFAAAEVTGICHEDQDTGSVTTNIGLSAFRLCLG